MPCKLGTAPLWNGDLGVYIYDESWYGIDISHGGKHA